MKFFNLNRSKTASRSLALLAAVVMGMSLTACGGGSDKNASAAKEQSEAAVKTLPKLDKDKFATLSGKKLGPITVQVHTFSDAEKQKVKQQIADAAAITEKITVTPENCSALAKSMFSAMGSAGDSIDNIFLAVGNDASGKPQTITLVAKPSEASAANYEKDVELAKTCPTLNINMPDGRAIEMKFSAFKTDSYKNVKTINGYVMENNIVGKRAIIEVILENGQLMQVQSDTPENANQILKDAFKYLEIK